MRQIRFKKHIVFLGTLSAIAFLMGCGNGNTGNSAVKETVTPTVTETVQITETPTATNTPTVKPTATNTPTVKPTATNTPTVKPTATNTPTVKPTATNTPTVKPTATNTPTKKPTATNTPTKKPTATNTPTAKVAFVPTVVGKYEAENAKLSGGPKTESKSGASGNKVARMESAGTISFEITVSETASYDINVVSCGIGGSKENNLKLDGTFVCSIKSDSKMGSSVANRISLSAGKHTLTIEPSWGWTQFDYIEIITTEPISEDMYKVSKQLNNTKASENTKRLYSYLCDMYGNYILSGQTCDKGPNGGEIYVIKQTTGKEPAILAMDLMDYTPGRPDGGKNGKTIEYAKQWWSKGGIVEFHWHWTTDDKYVNGNWYSSFYTASTTFDLTKAINKQDQYGYDMLINGIDAIAVQLKKLADEDIPVIFRPLHEASGGWFWWGNAGADSYKKLYRLMYERLTDYWGLNNLIWLWNGQSADWYVGDEYCDIIGTDIYPGERVYTSQSKSYFELMNWTGVKKPVYMSECGCIFDPELAWADGARWGAWAVWQGEYVKNSLVNKIDEKYTEAYMMKKAYADEHVITLDEIPDIKSYPME